MSWIRLGVFLGLWNSSYKLILCLWRRFFKEDKYSSLIAGFISAFALSFEKSSRRLTIALYLFARALHSAWLKIDNDSLQIETEGGEVIVVWCLAAGIVFFSAYHLDTISKSTYKMVFSSLRQK